MRLLRLALLAGGALGLVTLAHHLDGGAIVAALSRITWWHLALICLVYGLNMAVDTLAWRCTLARDRAPYRKLLAARCGGEAANVLAAVGSIGGEAIKAWSLRRDVPYEVTVPSLILSKTGEVVAQALLLAAGVLVASTTDLGAPTLVAAMGYLLLVEAIGVGGFLLAQLVGLVGRAGRVLAWAGVRGALEVQGLDKALRTFYRREWPRFLLAVALHLVGLLLGVTEALLILHGLGLPPFVATALVLEALWSGVRFATFLVPGSLGPLEGANAAAFEMLGFGAGSGLAFTFVRRARQMVWIGIGIGVLALTRPSRSPGEELGKPVPSGAA